MPFSLKLLFSGSLDKKTHGLYLLILLIFILTCLGISQLLYVGGYNWTHRFISEEGNPDKNPVGWIFFTLGICSTAVLLVPHSIYLYRALKPTMLFLSRINFGFLILGSIGLFIVGSVNENIEDFHNLGATLAFGSFGLGAFCSFIICIRKLFLHAQWPPFLGFLFLYAIIISLGAYIAYHFIQLPHSETSRYQWTGFFTILTYFYGMYVLIQQKKE